MDALKRCWRKKFGMMCGRMAVLGVDRKWTLEQTKAKMKKRQL